MPKGLTGLRIQSLGVTLIFLTVILLVYNALALVWSAQDARAWLAAALALMSVQMVILWASLESNHVDGSSVRFSSLGIANAMTLMRGLLGCLLAGFIFVPMPTETLIWAPAILYATERAIDFFDGYVARMTRGETQLGSILDIEYDGLGILIAVALAIHWDKLPGWYLILGIARPLFVLGIYLRRRWGKAVFDLPPSDNRRLVAGLQTAFVAIVLWPVLPVELTRLAALFFAVPLFVSFGRDWLVVSGVWDAASPRYQEVRTWAKKWIEGWLPLAGRCAGALSAVAILWLAAPDFERWQQVFGSPANGSASTGAAVFASMGLLATILLLLGAVGRAAALLLMVLASVDVISVGIEPVNAWLLGCATIVLHLGSGRFSIWLPEERFLHRPLGAPTAAES